MVDPREVDRAEFLAASRKSYWMSIVWTVIGVVFFLWGKPAAGWILLVLGFAGLVVAKYLEKKGQALRIKGEKPSQN